MIGDPGIPNSVDSFDWKRSLAVATEAAEAASEVLLARFRPPEGASLELQYKGPGDLVTDADLAADRAIANVLQARGNLASILSEESSQLKGDSQLTWLVDPLCGTLPFSTGLTQWGVNVALSVESQLEVGAIALPVTGEILSAARGHGAYLNGKVLNSREPPGDVPDVLLAFEGDRRNFTKSQHALEDAMGRHYTFASAAYPLAQVVLGRLHGFVGSNINVHTAAGAVIARELGICVTDETGSDVNWTPDDSYTALVVAWPRTHESLLSRLALE